MITLVAPVFNTSVSIMMYYDGVLTIICGS